MPTSPGVGTGPLARRPRGVVVAGELTPAAVSSLDPQAVPALVAAAGAPLSHAAILARSLGIPAVTGLGPAVLDIPEGTVVLVDGDAGTVCVAPTPAEVDAGRARALAARRRHEEARRLAGGPATTHDGQEVPVLANVGSRGDAVQAVAEGADGVGMLRTEFAFLDRTAAPGEDEQYQAYLGVAEALGERPLILRTLDLGADVPAWGAPPEPNPALGNRGLRLSLAWPELLERQLAAVARLARARPLRVMFPMVTTVDELHRARACLEAAAGDAPQLQVGITVEVPAAALTAEAFAPLVDFFAIGTNDLTQYTLAADRANAAVAGLADGLHPAVLRLIREVTAAGERHGRPVEVVGELGSDPLGVPMLLGLGVDMLSVRPNAVATVKQLVRRVSVADGRAAADAALGAASAAEVRELAATAWPCGFGEREGATPAPG